MTSNRHKLNYATDFPSGGKTTHSYAAFPGCNANVTTCPTIPDMHFIVTLNIEGHDVHTILITVIAIGIHCSLTKGKL